MFSSDKPYRFGACVIWWLEPRAGRVYIICINWWFKWEKIVAVIIYSHPAKQMFPTLVTSSLLKLERNTPDHCVWFITQLFVSIETMFFSYSWDVLRGSQLLRASRVRRKGFQLQIVLLTIKFSSAASKSLFRNVSQCKSNKYSERCPFSYVFISFLNMFTNFRSNDGPNVDSSAGQCGNWIIVVH